MQHILIFRYFSAALLTMTVMASSRANEWRAHEVRQLTGKASVARLPAKLQIVTEHWNRVAAVSDDFNASVKAQEKEMSQTFKSLDKQLKKVIADPEKVSKALEALDKYKTATDIAAKLQTIDEDVADLKVTTFQVSEHTIHNKAISISSTTHLNLLKIEESFCFMTESSGDGGELLQRDGHWVLTAPPGAFVRAIAIQLPKGWRAATKEGTNMIVPAPSA